MSTRSITTVCNATMCLPPHGSLYFCEIELVDENLNHPATTGAEHSLPPEEPLLLHDIEIDPSALILMPIPNI